MICENVDTKTLIHSLMYVNKLFYTIISDTYLWKKKFTNKFHDDNVAFMMTKAYDGKTTYFQIV